MKTANFSHSYSFSYSVCPF